jgi:hypothetical protein
LEPDRLDSGDHVMWTSGIVFGRGEVHYPVKVLWMFQCSPGFSSSTAAHNFMCAFSQFAKGNSFWLLLSRHGVKKKKVENNDG